MKRRFFYFALFLVWLLVACWLFHKSADALKERFSAASHRTIQAFLDDGAHLAYP